MSNKCPVPAPKLLKADSTVETCASCGAWIERYPTFLGESDSFWQCEKCGCTSVKLRDGRPYGPKSGKWAQVVSMFEDAYLDIPYWDWDKVEAEPPLQSLNWEAIEQWFESQNIYRIFINPFIAVMQQSQGDNQ